MAKKRDISKLNAAQTADLKARIQAYVKAGVPLQKAVDAVMGHGSYLQTIHAVHDILEKAKRY